MATSKMFSFRSSDELTARIETEAKTLKLTDSDVIRRAVEFYFLRTQQRQNFETLLKEVVWNRAVLIRCTELLGQLVPADLLQEARLDVEEYMQGRV